MEGIHKCGSVEIFGRVIFLASIWCIHTYLLSFCADLASSLNADFLLPALIRSLDACKLPKVRNYCSVYTAHVHGPCEEELLINVPFTPLPTTLQVRAAVLEHATQHMGHGKAVGVPTNSNQLK